MLAWNRDMFAESSMETILATTHPTGVASRNVDVVNAASQVTANTGHGNISVSSALQHSPAATAT